MIDVLNGPFGKASPLSDPDSGEHYRVVLADGWCGHRRNSRMDAYATVDRLRDLHQTMPWTGTATVGGVVRVIPRTSTLQERTADRAIRAHRESRS